MIDEEITDFEDDVTSSSDLFDCEFTSIDAVVNEVTVFTGFENRQTENGERTLVAYGEGINRSAFFTDSKKLKDVFCSPGRKYPMRAIIKVVRYGSMFGFRVFSPKAEVTQEDIDNFNYYKRTKGKKYRR